MILICILFSIIAQSSLYASGNPNDPLLAQHSVPSYNSTNQDSLFHSDQTNESKILCEKCVHKACPFICGTILIAGFIYGLSKYGSYANSSAPQCEVLQIRNCGTCTDERYSCAIPTAQFTEQLQQTLTENILAICGQNASYLRFIERCKDADKQCTSTTLANFQRKLKRDCKPHFLSAKFMKRSNNRKTAKKYNKK